jgi:hypothetical protein
MTPRELLRLVRARAWEVFLANKGDITFEASQRLAAKEIVAEHKAKPRRPTSVALRKATANSDITVKNARQVLLAQLRTLAERIRNPLTPSAPARDTQGVPRPGDESALTISKGSSPPALTATEPAPVAAGIFSGNSSTAELLPDDFPPSTSWADEPLRNWRASIETNERITRRDRWVG